ncbi:hypothetical protein CHKEEEPN_2468 [Methylorubrum podarium]|nr:hypothetical protein CHKEEEPN_2468 [Methylorubrum podarium]
MATAEVSEPPRPRVAIRPVPAFTPWKPEITATSPRANPSSRFFGSMPSIRAEPCASEVWIGICQPCQERALMPSLLRAMARSPEVTCSPEATTVSYSAAP